MSRRNRERAAQEAADRASEAGRILQSQRNSQPEPQDSPAPSNESLEPAGDSDDVPRPPLRNEPRRLAMEEIRARADQTRKEEVAQSIGQPERPAPEAALETPAPEPTQDAPVIPVAEAAPSIETVRVKVDGEEFDVPKAEVDEAGGVKLYQTTKAAENRLKKSAESLAQARQIQEAMVALAKQTYPQQPAQPQVTDDQFIASKLDAIRFGTPEEGATALREILKLNNPAIDTNHLTNQAVMQVSRNNAVNKFKSEFADVLGNPLLMKLAITLENERVAQTQLSPQFDFEDFYRRIGNEVRSVAARPTQPASVPVAQTTDPTSQVSPDKEARKASIVNLPTAAARAELPKDPKPETREEALIRMRKRRGLPTG